MTAYQFSQPWLSKLDGDQATNALEWNHLRTYLKGLDDGTIPFFNLNALNSTITNLTVAGNIAMGGFKLTGLGAGSTNGDSLRYEQLIGLYLLLTGGTMSGAIAMGSNKVTGLAAGSANGDALRYEQLIGLYLLLTGGTMSGAIAMGSNKITGLTNGTASGDVVNFGQLQNDSLNILDNAGFEGYGWQRGTSFSAPANGAYLADRWYVSSSETTNVTVTKETTVVDTAGLASMKVVVASAGASQTWGVWQKVENGADYRGKTVIATVRVWSDTASAIRIQTEDSTGAGGTNSSYHTGGSSWETLTSVAFTVAATATDIHIKIGMIAAGDKKAGTYYFDSAMYVIGSEAVAFVPTNPAVDMNRCQRFFQVIGDGAASENLGVAAGVSTTGSIVSHKFGVPMRVAPTATVNNATSFSLRIASVDTACTTVTVDRLTVSTLRINASVAAGLAVNRAYPFVTSATNATIFLSADL